MAEKKDDQKQEQKKQEVPTPIKKREYPLNEDTSRNDSGHVQITDWDRPRPKKH